MTLKSIGKGLITFSLPFVFAFGVFSFSISTSSALGGFGGGSDSGGYGKTLEEIKDKGYIQCGVSQGLPGFSNPDDAGNWSGIDVEFCNAVAAAVFGDSSKVQFSPLSAKVRFESLRSGEIDLLARNTTWTFDRDVALGLEFVGVNYYDGQGFMVRRNLGVNSSSELDNVSVCTNTGTTTELNAADFFRANKLKYKIVAFEKADEVVAAYDAGRCDVYTTDRSGLAAQRTKLTNPREHKVLPEIISKEPLGPVVRQGDEQWADVVRWTLNALINAEELGLTSSNISSQKNSDNPKIRRFVGVEGEFGTALGLDDNAWAYNIIEQVGNYGEIYERTVGPKTPLGLSRGANALWTEGGILYAPPLR